MKTYEIIGKASSPYYLEMMHTQLGMLFGPLRMKMFGEGLGPIYFACFVPVRAEDVADARAIVRDVLNLCRHDGHQMTVRSSLLDQLLPRAAML